MIFSKRYCELLVNDENEDINDFIGDISHKVRKDIVNIMFFFSEPKTIRVSRYSKETEKTDALFLAISKYNHEIGYQAFSTYSNDFFGEELSGFTPRLFDVVELQYEQLSDKERKDFVTAINKIFNDNDIPWLLVEGKMIKIDSKQFEIDLKKKSLETLKELTDCAPKYKSAYDELQKAIEFYSKGEYAEAVANAEKSYESVMKIILNREKGNASDLTKEITNKLSLPNPITPEGFKNSVLMSLPYIRNNAASHGAGLSDSQMSKQLANLAINLAASLCTFLIEEEKSQINR